MICNGYQPHLNTLFGPGCLLRRLGDLYPDNYAGSWGHYVVIKMKGDPNLIYALAILVACGWKKDVIDSNSNTIGHPTLLPFNLREYYKELDALAAELVSNMSNDTLPIPDCEIFRPVLK